MVASLYAVAERAALSAHTPWETQSSDPAACFGGHQRRRNRGFQLSLNCSSSSSSSGRYSVVIAQKDIDPLRADRGALDRVSHIVLGPPARARRDSARRNTRPRPTPATIAISQLVWPRRALAVVRPRIPAPRGDVA